MVQKFCTIAVDKISYIHKPFFFGLVAKADPLGLCPFMQKNANHQEATLSEVPT